MKRLVLLTAIALIAVLGFYVAWPAWTGYRIAKAFETQDPALLEAKIDFPSVRTSLRPTVSAEVERTIERTRRDAGPLGALIAGQIKTDVTTRLVDGALNSVITPPNVIRIAREGGNFKQTMERVMLEQVGKGLGGSDGGGRQAGGLGGLGDRIPGGLGGIAKELGGQRRQVVTVVPAQPAPGSASSPPKTSFGIGNIKSFAFDGPLAFSVGVARDQAASEPDLTATLRFTGGDWKVVGLVPRR